MVMDIFLPRLFAFTANTLGRHLAIKSTAKIRTRFQSWVDIFCIAKKALLGVFMPAARAVRVNLAGFFRNYRYRWFLRNVVL